MDLIILLILVAVIVFFFKDFIPSTILEILARYSAGLLYDIFEWLFVFLFIAFLFYLIKYFIKK